MFARTTLGVFAVLETQSKRPSKKINRKEREESAKNPKENPFAVFATPWRPLRLGFSSVLLVVFTCVGNAGGKDDLQKYFNDTAIKVKASSDAAEKRDILNTAFERMSKALDVVQNSTMVSDEEKAGIEQFRLSLIEKQDELAGRNGYERVSDEKLNDFSDYVVQDTEQAAEYITISVVTLLLILILVILIVK